jgi:GntR family transcriptional regulator
MTHPQLQTGPVTLYAQLAAILRDRIVTGIWKHGDDIPTLEQMVEEFAVARVTVRQAVQILAEEGLLSSQRGRRTYVTFQPPADDANPLYSSIGSVDSRTADYSITVLGRQEYDELPPQFARYGKPAGRYMRVRKLDNASGVPYSLSDNYVAIGVYRRFPAKAEHKVKLSRLVRDYARPPITDGIEAITVGSATYDEASHLQTTAGSPVARVTRAFLTADRTVIYLGVLVYRGDRFAIERDIGDALLNNAASPQAAAKSRM